MEVDVIFSKENGKVLAIRQDGLWVLPKQLDVMSFRRGSEPVLTFNDYGEIFIKPNAMIINPEN